MGLNKKKILWVSPDDPWSQWSNSGFIRMLCFELRRRHRLFGAMSPGATSLSAMTKPGPLYDIRRRVATRLGFRKGKRSECNENRGILAKVLRMLPPESVVIYQYMYPELDPNLSIQRLLFQDLTVKDAVESGSYGHIGLSDDEIKRRIEDQRNALASADGAVTFSTYGAESIVRDYAFPKEKIAAIGAGPVRAPSNVSFGIDRYAAGRLLFIGRQWERKGGQLLLDAFKLVRRKVPHATLTIAGAAIDPPDQDGVFYLGHVSNRKIARLFAGASCFAMPAKCETWGLVYTEAAAAGLPIVGFNAWAMPDIVIDGHSGILVDEQSIEALADALIRLLQHPEQMCSMGCAARLRMREVLDWSRVADRLLAKFIPEALGNRQPQWLRQ